MRTVLALKPTLAPTRASDSPCSYLRHISSTCSGDGCSPRSRTPSVPQTLTEPLTTYPQIARDQPQDLTCPVTALCLVQHRLRETRHRARQTLRELPRNRRWPGPTPDHPVRGYDPLQGRGKVRALSRYLHN